MRATPVLAAAGCVALIVSCGSSDPSDESLAKPGQRSAADSLSGIQNLPAWNEFSSPASVGFCANQGGSCGKGPRVSTTLTQNQTVDGFTGVAVLFSGDNVDGSCVQCQGDPASLWGANALWEFKHLTSSPPTVPVKSFSWTSDFKVPVGQTYQALEWDAQQSIRGASSTCSLAALMNFGMQYDPHGTGHWRFFDYGAAAWVDTGIAAPANLSDGAWHTLAVDWSVSGTTPTLVSMTFDGTTTPVNKSGHPGCRDYANAVSAGLQLDNVPGHSYSVDYKNYDVTWSTSSAAPTGCVIASPASGSIVGETFTVDATCTAAPGHNIVAVDVYDGRSSTPLSHTATTGNSAHVTPTQTDAAGTYGNMVVQAWDDSSPQVIYKTPLALTLTPPGCTVSSPANGATVGSPVSINSTCVAPAGHNIVGIRIYVTPQGGSTTNPYFSGTTTGNTVAIDPSVAMGAGTNNVIVQAWDDQSPQAIYKTPFTLTVQ